MILIHAGHKGYHGFILCIALYGQAYDPFGQAVTDRRSTLPLRGLCFIAPTQRRALVPISPSGPTDVSVGRP